jgi:hypothetical protein
MKKPFTNKLLVLLAIAGFVITGCEKISSFFIPKIETPNAIQEKTMNMPKIIGPYDLHDVNTMPLIVPMTNEQKLYLISVVDAVLRVITKKTALEQEETLFGKGEFFWPKDPQKPIKVSKSYDYENFRIKGLSLGFNRIDQNSVWSGAGITINPRNYPDGVYSMDLPASVFADFTLDKSFTEDRPEESIKRVNIFQFHLKSSQLNVKLQFEAREDVSSLQDKYPKSFHSLEITRIDK